MSKIRSFKERHYAFVANKLHELHEELADSLDRNPTSLELMELLAGAIRGSPLGTLADPPSMALDRFELRYRAGVRSAPTTEEFEAAKATLAELSDAAFTATADSIHDLSQLVVTETGEAPTLEEVETLILEGLRRCRSILADVSPDDILSIKSKRRKKIVATAGDLVAIPTADDRFFIACVIVRNRFGTAYGFFKGKREARPFSYANRPDVYRFPIYSHDKAIAQGRWRIIGHDKQLLQLFPEEPEIYHAKSSILNANNPAIGPFGAAENARGALRHISEAEAKEVGLTTGNYRQTYTNELLETSLPMLLGEG